MSYPRSLSALIIPFSLLTVSIAAFARQASAQAVQITLMNLTNPAPNSGQPFSPAVFVTHDASLTLWAAGGTASAGLRQIAEEGDNSVLLAALNPLVGTSIGEIATPYPTPMFPGNSVTFTVTLDPAHRFLSSVWMLGRTNDGFSGQTGLDLLDSASYSNFNLIGLDAGTENNNEQSAFMIALGGHQTDPENGVIHVHPGIQGIANAPLSWNWENPVARLSIVAVPEPGSLALFALPLVGLALTVRRRATIRF